MSNETTTVPVDVAGLVKRLQELYVAHGTNYVQEAAAALETLARENAALDALLEKSVGSAEYNEAKARAEKAEARLAAIEKAEMPSASRICVDSESGMAMSSDNGAFVWGTDYDALKLSHQKLAADNVNLRATLKDICDEWNEDCDLTCDSLGHTETCKATNIANAKKKLTADLKDTEAELTHYEKAYEKADADLADLRHDMERLMKADSEHLAELADRKEVIAAAHDYLRHTLGLTDEPRRFDLYAQKIADMRTDFSAEYAQAIDEMQDVRAARDKAEAALTAENERAERMREALKRIGEMTDHPSICDVIESALSALTGESNHG